MADRSGTEPVLIRPGAEAADDEAGWFAAPIIGRLSGTGCHGMAGSGSRDV
ncbi:hypothetical protein [Martelella sp. HB161492]|uniref:hypothetical protein n=1 Tax=Martelella sp. HB161492 TaxID=2720726 RepID=UPI00158FC502|nr:hypothetical protein [Martelella sp. HB161492]